MRYTRYTFTVRTSEPLDVDVIFDVLADELASLGFDSFVKSEDTLQAYIPSATQPDEKVLRKALTEFVLPNVSFDYVTQDEPDVNWNEEWERHYFRPLEFAGGRCVIRAPFHPVYRTADIELIISPKMAFGTGNHDTTSHIIDYLLAHPSVRLDVLDMGCGTGILGLIALKQGAKSLTAVDIDEWAYRNVMENAELNGLKDVPRMICGDASALQPLGTFDLILANITRNVLLADMHYYVRHLRKGGTLVLSGFYQADIPALRSCAEGLGLRLISAPVSAAGWSMMQLTLP